MKAEREKVRSFFPELERVSNRELVEKTIDLVTYFWKASKWEDIEEAPFSYEGTYLRFIQHTQATVAGAVALADILVKVQHETIDYDTLICGAILHDVSKPVEYDAYDENGCAVHSKEGVAYQHAFLGAAKAVDMGFPVEIVSIILCHTPQSTKKIGTIEGLLLMCADHASAHAANRKFD